VSTYSRIRNDGIASEPAVNFNLSLEIAFKTSCSLTAFKEKLQDVLYSSTDDPMTEALSQ
jgi:hypothetical protein